MAVYAVDIDDTLADFNGKLRRIYNKRYLPHRIDRNHFNLCDIDECFDELTAHRLKDIFNEKGFFSDLKLLPGAFEVVNALIQRNHSIYLVTAPPRRANLGGAKAVNPGAATEKISWIMQKFPKLAQNTVITSHKYLIKADMLIDDNVNNIRGWCQAHPQGIGYLIDQPWNRAYQELPTNSCRGSLKDVLDIDLRRK